MDSERSGTESAEVVMPMDVDSTSALSDDALESTFGPLVSIPDELATPRVASPLDLPVATVRVHRLMLVFGGLITLAITLQTALLLFERKAAPIPSVRPTTVSSQSQELESLLVGASQNLDQGFYQDVVRQLHELEESAVPMSKEQKFRLYSLLSHASQRLGDSTNAASYGSKATDQFLEHESAAGLLLEGGEHRDGDRLTRAVRSFAQILALADGVEDSEKGIVPVARTRLAECYVSLASEGGTASSLPGVPVDQRDRADGTP